MQLLLLPDPRPLVERLGAEFFQNSPECAGVYLMRDESRKVLYVGKAKNLRKRLSSYRVANPDRLPRRHLRLLRSVRTIEFERCEHESAALDRESILLRKLRPRYNRAGTWAAPRRFLLWRSRYGSLEFKVSEQAEEGWMAHGPVGSGKARLIHQALCILAWFLMNTGKTVCEAPQGLFRFRPAGHQTMISGEAVDECAKRIAALLAGELAAFDYWIREQLCLGEPANAGLPRGSHISRFEVQVILENLELILETLSAKTVERPAPPGGFETRSTKTPLT